MTPRGGGGSTPGTGPGGQAPCRVTGDKPRRKVWGEVGSRKREPLWPVRRHPQGDSPRRGSWGRRAAPLQSLRAGPLRGALGSAGPACSGCGNTDALERSVRQSRRDGPSGGRRGDRDTAGVGTWDAAGVGTWDAAGVGTGTLQAQTRAKDCMLWVWTGPRGRLGLSTSRCDLEAPVGGDLSKFAPIGRQQRPDWRLGSEACCAHPLAIPSVEFTPL
ncbi:PREDICTED: uncharacterized protein LOC109396713 [Hipposideros armiger]|uniref:Uncharacterized protein LOC109396713 n=1 Tax=Hipposideros armiger TaxID=186990 RepID=A0A8B7THN6_HIPAR|nr:PREDICTED: uncharacterized protein LOC109396713 [Hipposideros armiger]